MASSPDNYMLGKGIASFNRLISGDYLGELDLGNAPEFTFSMPNEKIDHYSSRGGLRVKDKSEVSEISPTISFTLDEINKENLELLTFGNQTVVTQKTALITGETHKGAKGKKVKLDKRGILENIIQSSLILTTDDPTTAATRGDVINGDSSGASAVVLEWDGATDTYTVFKVTGTFEADETLTVAGGTATEAGTLNSTGFFTAGTTPTAQTLTVTGSSSGVLVKDTDFSIVTTQKDDKIGRILLNEGGKVVDGETLTFVYTCDQVTYTEIRGISETTLEGSFRYVSDNPFGNDFEFEAWRVSLSPSGDTGFIGEDWSTMAFTGEILKDEVGHPDSPYFNVIPD